MKAKKSLGQNFLKSPSAIKTMITAANISSTDTILEIGPGKGVLTKPLMEKASKVVAVEKDTLLYEQLLASFAELITKNKLILLNADILNLDITEYLKGESYKIVANIPYNITGAILKKFLSQKKQPKSITLMVQKEVAERIVTRDSKESVLSISIKIYGTPHYIQKVPARYFSPKPKVDSAIIHIDNISKKQFINEVDEARFFEILKTGFAHKRKTLRSNLSNIFDKELILHIFKELHIEDVNIRPEKISVDLWKSIHQKIYH